MVHARLPARVALSAVTLTIPVSCHTRALFQLHIVAMLDLEQTKQARPANLVLQLFGGVTTLLRAEPMLRSDSGHNQEANRTDITWSKGMSDKSVKPSSRP